MKVQSNQEVSDIVEKYIRERKLEVKYKPLGEICWFHGYGIDRAVGHLSRAGLIVLD